VRKFVTKSWNGTSRENTFTIDTLMNCPACHSEWIRRSRRRSALDYLFSVASVLPWRCMSCRRRFRARAVPIHYLFYAHCPICGNVDLQRIAPVHVPGIASALWRILKLPAMRCEFCRHKFFTLRPLLRRKDGVAAV
jgi:DNA-directed RNA polymerase subunit RPC12/RpoP